jgi:hypothetical protein
MGVLILLLTVTGLTGCGKQPQSSPATPVATQTVSADCLGAMRNQLDSALYKPDAQEINLLPECESESEDAIGRAAEQLLRETFDSPSASPTH